jgi:adenosine deaminase
MLYNKRATSVSPLTRNYPFQTDDKGVFATSLSQEYMMTADSYDLSREQLWQMALSSIDYTFASEEEKNHLKDMFLHIKQLSDIQ